LKWFGNAALGGENWDESGCGVWRGRHWLCKSTVSSKLRLFFVSPFLYRLKVSGKSISEGERKKFIESFSSIIKSRSEMFLPKRGKAVGDGDVNLPPKVEVDFRPRWVQR
jgi:hypothetical protein